MLPQNRRVKKTDFEQLKKIRGKNFDFGYFSVKVFNSAEFKDTRFAVVVPSSVSKKAVARNKYRRWIKAVILTYLKEVKENLTIIIYLKKRIESFEKISEDIGSAFKKIKILK